MVYLPIQINSNNCAYVYDSNIIRVYDSRPTYNTTIQYTDFFINSHYLTRSGSTSFGQYQTLNYDCIAHTDFTTNIWYRIDISDISITFGVWFAIIILFIGFFCKTFRRGLFRWKNI